MAIIILSVFIIAIFTSACKLMDYCASAVKILFKNLGGLCRSEVNVSIIQGTYSWPYKKPGQSVSQKCQYGSAGQNVTRLCNGNLTWTESASKCPTEVSDQVKQLIMLVANVCTRFLHTYCSDNFSFVLTIFP